LPLLRLLTRPPQCPFKTVPPDFAMQIAREAFHPKRSGKRAPRPNPFSVEAIFDNIKTRTSRHAFAFGIRP
jgi:hypothetical protein